MEEVFLLDTNAYFRLVGGDRDSARERLVNRIKRTGQIEFSISEMSALEARSVLGKYRRGRQRNSELCCREVLDHGRLSRCGREWVSVSRKRMRGKVFRDLLKMLSDIENGRGQIRATLIPLDKEAVAFGRKLLSKHADRFNFGSHDAVIGGTAVALNQRSGKKVVVVTSDKGFKAVLAEESIDVFDPNTEPD